MKKLLSILSAVSLTATGASSVIACNKPKHNNMEKNKILEENINNTSLKHIADSTKEKKSEEAENKIYEFQNKEIEYRNKFETNNKDIDLQLWQLFSLRKEEAVYKTSWVKHGKLNKLPPEENDPRRYLYKKIQQIKSGTVIFNKKEYQINQLLINLVNKLENKYYK